MSAPSMYDILSGRFDPLRFRVTCSVFLALAFGSASTWYPPRRRPRPAALDRRGDRRRPRAVRDDRRRAVREVHRRSRTASRAAAPCGPSPVNTANSRRLGRFWPAALPQVEIKHGRISMMAFLGMMVQELGIPFPGSMTLDGPAPRPSVAFTRMAFSRDRRAPRRLRPVLGHLRAAGLPGAGKRASARPPPDRRLRLRGRDRCHAGDLGTGGRRTPRRPRRVIGTIPGSYRSRTRSGRHGAQPRPHVRAQGSRRAMLSTGRRHAHSELDSRQHRFYRCPNADRARGAGAHGERPRRRARAMGARTGALGIGEFDLQ